MALRARCSFEVLCGAPLVLASKVGQCDDDVTVLLWDFAWFLSPSLIGVAIVQILVMLVRARCLVITMVAEVVESFWH